MRFLFLVVLPHISPLQNGQTFVDNGIVFESTMDQIKQFGQEKTSCSLGKNFPRLGNAHRILGGKRVNNYEHRWPWIVRVETGKGRCGGVIISPFAVLTAAHCCIDEYTITAHFGDVNIKRQDISEFSQTISADRIHIHEEYSRSSDGSPLNKDLCILETTSNVLRARNFHCRKKLCTATPCIPKSDFLPGSRCWIAGWGARERYRGRSQDTLWQAGVNSMSYGYCMAKSKNQYYTKMKEDDELCAFSPDRDGNGYLDRGTDSCQGDSGGPLICERDGKPELTGIVSWGRDCGVEGKPGIYQNVFRMKDWIEDRVIQIERKQTTRKSSLPDPCLDFSANDDHKKCRAIKTEKLHQCIGQCTTMPCYRLCSDAFIQDLEDCPCGNNCPDGCPCETKYSTTYRCDTRAKPTTTTSSTSTPKMTTTSTSTTSDPFRVNRRTTSKASTTTTVDYFNSYDGY